MLQKMNDHNELASFRSELLFMMLHELMLFWWSETIPDLLTHHHKIIYEQIKSQILLGSLQTRYLSKAHVYLTTSIAPRMASLEPL